MFATIKSLIPEPRRAENSRHYVGRHRRSEPLGMPVSAAPAAGIVAQPDEEPAEETAAA